MFYQDFFIYFFTMCTQTLGLYSIQDYIELLVFIVIIYKTLNWLKQDHTNNLLLGSYAYFAMLLFSYSSNCTILFSTLLFAMPLCIMFALIAHQKQLQKNFILSTKQQFVSTSLPQKNWIENVIQSCLIACHHNKTIVCIIERSQDLNPLLQTPFLLHIPIQQDIVSFLLASTKVTDNSMLLIHESGIIQSINVTWSQLLLNELIIQPTNSKNLTHEAALILTQKTDALLFTISTNTDHHTIWYQGACLKQTTIQQLLIYIKNILSTTHVPVLLKKRINHDQSSSFTS